jgi:hypothetical protein
MKGRVGRWHSVLFHLKSAAAVSRVISPAWADVMPNIAALNRPVAVILIRAIVDFILSKSSSLSHSVTRLNSC